MSDLLLGDHAGLLHMALKTTVYALWYSALFWLPVRALCALIDRRRSVGVDGDGVAEPYRVGMQILPPM